MCESLIVRRELLNFFPPSFRAVIILFGNCTTSRDGQGRGTWRYHLDKTNCQLPSRSSHLSDKKTKGTAVSSGVHVPKILCIFTFVCDCGI